MAQIIIPGEGGVWVLVEENADTCSLDSAPGVAGETIPDEGLGKGPIILFLTAVGAAALHLTGA